MSGSPATPSPSGSLRYPLRRRHAVAVIAAAAAVVTLAACSSSGGSSGSSSASNSSSPNTAASGTASSSGQASAGKKFTIALVPGITTDPFYITMQNGAEAEAKKLGVKLIWQGGTDFTAASQTPVVQALLAKHPDALLIAPTDATAMKNPIEQYVKAKIPVISVDTTLNDTSLFDARITSDNTQGGKEAADTIAKLAHDKGQVAVLDTTPGTSTTNARRKGFVDEIKAKYPNMSVVAQEFDQDKTSTAASQTSSIMLAHPGLVGVFATNLASAEGAGTAVTAANKSGKVFVVGYDAEPKEVQLLKKGTINALIVQQPAEEGATAVKDAYDILTGKASQVTKSVQLPNVTATTKTANDPSVSKYFYASQLAK